MANDLKPIRNWDDHATAMVELEKVWGAKPDSPEEDRLDLLATIIDAFESRSVPFDLPDPIEAIKFRMDQQGLTRKDLEPMLGSRARVAEILNRKRGLSLPMIRRLHEALGISLEVLVRPTKRDAA